MFFNNLHNFRNAYFLSSFTVFIILNTVENIIHYNIGRISEKGEDIHFYYPNKRDIYRIIIIMIIFAILQALLSGYIEKIFIKL